MLALIDMYFHCVNIRQQIIFVTVYINQNEINEQERHQDDPMLPTLTFHVFTDLVTVYDSVH